LFRSQCQPWQVDNHCRRGSRCESQSCKLRTMAGLRYVFASWLFAGTLPAGDSNEAIFREKILPSLQANCASCHGGVTPASSFSVADFNGVLTGGKHGPAIMPGTAASSLRIQYLHGKKTPQRPMGGSISA